MKTKTKKKRSVKMDEKGGEKKEGRDIKRLGGGRRRKRRGRSRGYVQFCGRSCVCIVSRATGRRGCGRIARWERWRRIEEEEKRGRGRGREREKKLNPRDFIGALYRCHGQFLSSYLLVEREESHGWKSWRGKMCFTRERKWWKGPRRIGINDSHWWNKL